MGQLFAGIDVGSETTKGVILDGSNVIGTDVFPTGFNHTLAADTVKKRLFDLAKIADEKELFTVSTGCGGKNVTFRNLYMSDMICCAKGINELLPSVRTIISIGSQSSEIICMGDGGEIIDFAVSEKCAGATGYILKVIADLLLMKLEDMGPLSLKSKKPVSFNSGCAVFAESEAISMIGEGCSREDILAGIHKSLASKILVLSRRINMQEKTTICGGVALNEGLILSIEKRLGIKLISSPNPEIVGALGAALIAGERASVV